MAEYRKHIFLDNIVREQCLFCKDKNIDLAFVVIYCGINIVYMILVTILQPCTRVCI